MGLFTSSVKEVRYEHIDSVLYTMFYSQLLRIISATKPFSKNTLLTDFPNKELTIAVVKLSN